MGTKASRSKPRGGFTYRRTERQIREWMAVPAEIKLRWIEETNHFIWHASPPGMREIRERIRRGEL